MTNMSAASVADIPEIEVIDTVLAELDLNALVQCRNVGLQTLELGGPQSVRCPINLSFDHRPCK